MLDPVEKKHAAADGKVGKIFFMLLDSFWNRSNTDTEDNAQRNMSSVNTITYHIVMPRITNTTSHLSNSDEVHF